MAEIYVKDDNGKFKNLGDTDLDKIKNVINFDDLVKYVNEYWTEQKSGKHPELSKKHLAILKEDLTCYPKDLFEQISKNKFTFQDFGPIKFNKFLKYSKLEEYLKSEYVEHALEVTTYQPAIGKGEFLLVSCFNNINFVKDSGDLIDNDGNRIEVKGINATVGGIKGFKQMNKSLIFSIYRYFNLNPEYTSLTIECIEQIDKLLREKNNRNIKPIMMILQNNEKESEILANEMVELFNETSLINVIASAHLYAYLRLQKANFLFALNETSFAGFSSPKNLKNSLNIIKKFKINGWTTGNRGITFSLI